MMLTSLNQPLRSKKGNGVLHYTLKLVCKKSTHTTGLKLTLLFHIGPLKII